MLFIFLSSLLKDGSLEDDSDEDVENEEPDNRDYVSVLRFVLEEDVSGTFNTCSHAHIAILRHHFDRANDVCVNSTDSSSLLKCD